MSEPHVGEVDPTIHRVMTLIRSLVANASSPLSPEQEHECWVVLALLKYHPARIRPKGGILVVGLTPDEREVVMNFPEGVTGHIIFSPDQARSLGEIMIEKSRETVPGVEVP